jgi:hypothetical protein
MVFTIVVFGAAGFRTHAFLTVGCFGVVGFTSVLGLALTTNFS